MSTTCSNPDCAEVHVDPFRHFETVGWNEGRNPSAYFDTAGHADDLHRCQAT